MPDLGYNPTGPFAPLYQRDTVPYPYTVDPWSASGVQAFGGANRAVYMLARNCSGTLTNLGVYVGTSSGNISLAVYNSSSSGLTLVPNARLATTGAVACPTGSAFTSVALTAAITLDPTVTYWFAISCDNTTATFARVGAVAGAAVPGINWQQGTAHPCPDPAASLTQPGLAFSIMGS